MSERPIPENESERLKALDSYEILDTIADERLDNLTKLASEICEVPICLISLIDESRQWFKSRVGLDVPQTPREISFCQHAILGTELMQVENALEDEKFVNNPLVTGDPNIRFYAGQPLIDKNGFALGTLCVIDSQPNSLNEHQKRALKTLSTEVISAIEQAKIEKERVQYQRFFEMSLDLLCIADTNGYFKQINPSFSSMLGYTQEELLSQPFVNFVHPDDLSKTYQEMDKLNSGEKSIGFENRYKTKEGNYVWLHWTCHPDANGSDLFAVAHDITELKKSQEQLNINNKNLDDFAHIVSHDLKAPLRAIHGFVSFLEEDLNGKMDETCEENFALVKNRAERMSMMIDGILAYTRAGFGSIDKVKINSQESIQKVFDSLNLDKKFTLEFKNPLPEIIFNELQFSQIIQNIIDNSIKYQDKTVGIIQVECSEEDTHFVFSISDNGPGIPEKSQQRVFDIFQTLQPKNGFENNGVGLSIVKKIIQDNGGIVQCKSELGEGTCFIFTINK